MRATGIAIAWSVAASAGCFYVEPINQRPSLDIQQRSVEAVFRGDTITLEAVASDPERHVVAFQWRAYACTDAIQIEQCDLDPLLTGVEPEFTFTVPAFRADPDGDGPEAARPVESVRVVLEGRDDHGAAARPDQVLTLPVRNREPTLRLVLVSTHGAVGGVPLDVFAEYGDADDTAANVTLAWVAFSPTQAPAALDAIPAEPGGDPKLQRQARRFTPAPQEIGSWDVQVTATDPLGGQARANLTIAVADDAPPCLDAWAPAATAQPAPITEPTVFRAIQVRDDLDAYPRTSSASFVGEPAFVWSMKIGAGPRQVLSNPTSALAFDPGAYPPGTLAQLRVEIFDRNAAPITCADAAPTCSVTPQPTCIQRQTWHVEAR